MAQYNFQCGRIEADCQDRKEILYWTGASFLWGIYKQTANILNREAKALHGL
jgi:hypothetical protein